jgi:hypothetical protein
MRAMMVAKRLNQINMPQLYAYDKVIDSIEQEARILTSCGVMPLVKLRPH